MKYIVKKRFVDGLLKGLEVVEKTDVKFQVGKQYRYYIVVMVQEVQE